ncbi:fibronectin type III domain-containing protein [uncultured Robinsoniella sp.]|uniref:fibronectin type III domain-containing protein n=1 Tax=uncultured Robinsoniella sp. TaxID=904190 RepID=UPI00374FA32E
MILPKSPTIKYVKKSGSNKAKVSFGKVKGASGYQISYTANNKTKKITTKKSSYTLKKLKSRRYYNIKVRAYVKIGSKKYYGPYSYSRNIWM